MPDTKIIQSAPKAAQTEVDIPAPFAKDILAYFAHDNAGDIPASQIEEYAKERLVELLFIKANKLDCGLFDFVCKSKAKLLRETAINRNEWLERNVERFDNSPSDGWYTVGEEGKLGELDNLLNACEQENPSWRPSGNRVD